MDRAFSVLSIKAVDEGAGKRRFTGVASTVSTDRSADIVEPRGMQVEMTPTPLLWQHDANQPIGWVHVARVTDTEIVVECEVAQIPEEGLLKTRVDMAWQSIKNKLVRGLSIGFRTIKSEPIPGTTGRRFLKWALHELSVVVIPANVQANIVAIKAADSISRRAPQNDSWIKLDDGRILSIVTPSGEVHVRLGRVECACLIAGLAQHTGTIKAAPHLAQHCDLLVCEEVKRIEAPRPSVRVRLSDKPGASSRRRGVVRL